MLLFFVQFRPAPYARCIIHQLWPMAELKKENFTIESSTVKGAYETGHLCLIIADY